MALVELAKQRIQNRRKKNDGNALSYLGKNLGAGALGMFEGAYDFIVGGAASLFGDEEYAKYLQANDISGRIQQQAMQEFNPSKGWQFAGDVASGLGQTAAGIGVGLATGGAGAGALATKLAVGATIGAGAAGKSTGAAFQKTGELGAKEYTYGALSGALEMGLETLTGAGGKIASRLTSQTATAVAKNAVRSGIVKTMISEGAGEFVEEALSEILDAPLQRITGIDKEAENANINDVVRAGLVGFVSGAIGSGIGSSVQNVSNLKRGTNIEKNGQTESILNRANTLKNEIVDNAEDVTLVAEPLKALSASVTAYDSLKKQDSVKGRMLLGEIQKGLAYVEVSSGVQHSYNNIVKEAEAIANTAYFKENYKGYTVEDIKNNKNDIAKELAVNDFVGKMMISPEEYASTLKKGELPVGATKYQEFIAQADGNTIKRLSVELGIDLNTANYEEVRRHLADYSKTKGKSIADGQIATYLNAIFGDVMEVDENGKINTKIKKLPKNIKVAVGEKAIYKTKDGTIVGIVHSEKGYFVGIDETSDGEKGFQTANTLNESEFAKFINMVRRKFNGETDTAVKATTKAQKTSKAKETKVADVKEENKTKKAEVKKEQAKARALEIIKQKGTEKAKTAEDTKYAVKDKKQESKVKAEARGDLTQAKETARKYVKDFDMYDTDTKGRIVEAIISGEQYKVDETTQKAIANILAVRKNLNVSFSNIAENGMYYTIKNEKGATQRYAVINPSTNIVRQTILHELTHDLEGDARFEAMANVALQNTPKEKVDAKRKLYEKHYKKIGKVFNEDILTAEITADYFAEQLGESKFIEQYATNEDLGIFQRAKKWLSDFVAKLPLGKAKTEAIKLNRLYDRLIQGEWKGVEGTARIKHSLIDSNGKELTEAQLSDPYTMTSTTNNLGETLSVGQVLHHSESQVRDEQGRLLAVYHGTNAEFTVFDEKKIGQNYYQSEGGFFFTNRKSSAENYAELHYLRQKDGQAKVIKAYLNIKKPYIVSVPSAWQGAEFFDDHRSEILSEAELQGADGIIAESKLGSLYIAFNSNQIKLTTNLNPTVNEDIRFSVDEVDTMEVVQTEVEEKEVALKTILKNKRYTKIAANNFVVSTQIMFTNDMAGIERVLKSDAKTAKKAEAVSQEFRTAQAKAMAKLGNYQYDTVKDIYKADIKGKELGKGVHAIFEPINRRGTAYLAKFEDYAYNKHNIDRMKVGKTVNGASQNQSKAIVAEYERTNPEFKKYMKEVTDFCKNELKMDFDAGVISEEDYNFYVKRYGNYVPSYRDMTAEEVAKSFAMNTEMVRVSAIAKKKAKGGTIKILPLEYAIALQTTARERQIATNKMANLLYDAHLNGNTTDVTSVEKMEIDEADKKNPDRNYDKLTPKDNTVIFFRNGEQYSMQVSKYVFAGFDSQTKHFNKVDSAVIKAIEKANKGFKTLVTSANPLFIARNFARDMQEALFYTKYGTAKFLKHYATAISQVKSNGDYWKLYQAMGGFNSSIFNFNTGKIAEVNMRGFEKASNTAKLAMLKKVVLTCENANLLVEQLPRFAEFIASMENGNTAQQALVDSADVTCNFGRGGTLTRLLNRTIMPFLNPAVQGASKFVRNITGARTARAIGSLVLKATILGILPQALSMAMYKDDEEYQGMTDYIKESYWLFKIGDTWAKIPKGRVTAFITSTYIHGDKVAKGDDVWENVKAVGKSFSQNLTPVENVGRTIFSPFYDIKTNTTWYGGSIENLGMSKAEPRNRYDESTSKIAIWLGDKINYSPKKIHYLFDQYSGIIGDILLPATNSKAEVDIFKSNFTVDPVTQNKYSQEFYDLVDEVGKAKDSALRAGDTEAETDNKLQARFLNNAKKGASAIFDEISKIQGSDLSNADKLAQVRVLRGTINQIYTTALTDIDAVREAIGATAYIDDYDLRYAEVTRLVYGAERALRTYNSKVYEKAQTINKAGISYQDYYEVYFKTRGIESEKDKQGNTIAGSKKKKVIKEIATLKIPTAQKLFLIYAQGYTIKDGEVKGFTEVRAKRVVATYIDELNLTAEEKKTLIDLCGI